MASANPILPAPEPLISHHLASLGKPMQEWASSRHIPPVLLLTGPSGIGKRTLAHYLAQWIFCEKTGLSPQGGDENEGEMSLFGAMEPPPQTTGAQPLQPCGQCVQCMRAIKGSWVDFTEIRAGAGEAAGDSDSKNETLKIDQFRKMKESMGFSAHEGGHRIFLIPDADRMTTQAANSVLKILEEPPKGWIFLMTASDPTLMLPTVLSRCQSLKLRPLAIDSVRTLLSNAGVAGEKLKLASTLSGGSWGRALAFVAEEAFERRQAIFDFLERPQGSINTLVDWAAPSDSHFNLLCDQLELICVDLIRWSISEQHEWANFDGVRALKNHGERVVRMLKTPQAARDFWIGRSERIAGSRRQALTPVNRKLLIQDILIPWLEVCG